MLPGIGQLASLLTMQALSPTITASSPPPCTVTLGALLAALHGTSSVAQLSVTDSEEDDDR
jgi:hypothetical protein